MTARQSWRLNPSDAAREGTSSCSLQWSRANALIGLLQTSFAINRYNIWGPPHPSRYQQSGIINEPGLVIKLEEGSHRVKYQVYDAPNKFTPIFHALLDTRDNTMPERYYIPNNLDQWKWPRHINPHYPEVKAASAAWARSFGAFSPKAQEAYDRCDFSANNFVY